MDPRRPDSRPWGITTVAIVELALTTAYIHFTLGGLLFTLNAAGYVGLAAAMLLTAAVPHPVVQRFAWAPRLGLLAYAAATIVGYVIMGPYFSLGWAAKAIEVAIITLVAAELRHGYGSPAGVLRAALASVGLGSGPERVQPAA